MNLHGTKQYKQNVQQIFFSLLHMLPYDALLVNSIWL